MSAGFEMPPQAHPAGLTLRVKELDRALSFYIGMLGFDRDPANENGSPADARLRLGAGRFWLDLKEDMQAPLRPYPSVGLYHFALLLPDRPALAAIFKKLTDAGWDFEGAADHAVSEALYLRDPENNGIELYRDRPRQEWPVEHNGQIGMVTEPLNLYALLDEAPDPAPLHAETVLGHMHLHVDDLQRAELFYAAGMGLKRRASLRGASFLAAGDYHHHLGLNIWAGSRHAPAEATGLLDYTWLVPEGTLEDIGPHLQGLEIGCEKGSGGLVLQDPDGIGVRLATAL